MLPFTSLDAVTANGVGDARDLEGVARIHTMVVVVTGSPSTCRVTLEGSHDGVAYFALANVNDGSGIVTSSTHLVRHVRANLEFLTGGSSPTVSATIATADL